MRRADPQTVGEIIEKAIQHMGLTDTYDLQRACYLWPEIVGPQINRYTVNRWAKDGVLHVTLTSAALKNELLFQRASLVKHLNEALGRDLIRDIQFH